MDFSRNLESDVDAIFKTVQPRCVGVVKNPDVEHLNLLYDVLCAVPAYHLVFLQDYVLFPLRIVFKHSLKEKFDDKTLCRAMDCVQLIIKKTDQLERWNTFVDMFSQLFALLNSHDQPTRFQSLSEFVKLHILNALWSLVNAITPSQWLTSIRLKKSESSSSNNETFDISAEFVPILGHALYSLLQLIKFEKSHDLLLLVLQLLRKIVYLSSFDESISEATKDLPNGSSNSVAIASRCYVADLFATFLPGICSSLHKFLLSNISGSHVALCEGLELFTDCIVVVLNNSVNGDFLDDNLKVNGIKEDALKLGGSSLDSQSQQISCDITSIIRNRSPMWFKETVSRVKIIIDEIFPSLTLNDHWKVRQTVAVCGGRIFQQCSLSLSVCISAVLDSLMILSEDQMEKEVAAEAKNVIHKICLSSPDAKKKLSQIIGESLYKLCNSLPRLFCLDCNEVLILRSMKLLCGNFRTLDQNGITNFYNSSSHVRKFLLAAVQILEFDISRLPVVSEFPDEQHLMSNTPDVPSVLHLIASQNYKFRHVSSRNVLSAVDKVFQLFGQSEHADVLIEFLIDLSTESFSYLLPAVYMLNQILKGCLESNRLLYEFPTVISRIVDEYLAKISELNIDPVSNDTILTEEPETTKNRDALFASLCIDELAYAALVLSKMKVAIEPFLMKVLYEVIYYGESAHVSVQDSARLCLMSFAVAYGKDSVRSLLLENVDFLVHSLTMQLRHFSLFPRSPVVLVALIRLCPPDAEVLPKLSTLVWELLETLDSHYLEKSLMCLRSLQTIAKGISMQQYPVSPTVCNDNLNEQLLQTDDHLENDEDSPLQPKQEGEKSKASLHVKIVVAILKRTKHFLSSPVCHIHLLVLDILHNGLITLKDSTDELLPLIHENWPALSARFCEKLTRGSKDWRTITDLAVSAKAFAIICTTARLSGDFVYRRVVNDVLPVACQFLESIFPESLNSGNIYQHSNAFKLQLCILTNIGNLCLDITVLEKDLMPVYTVCCKYLHKKQPKQICDAAIQSIVILSRLKDSKTNEAYVNSDILSKLISSFDSYELYCENFNVVRGMLDEKDIVAR